jgi:hypothetical protein
MIDDNENNNNIDDAIDSNIDENIIKVPRKRGRPRKNDILKINVKKDVKKIPDEEKEIILHLPISLKDIDMDNLSDFDEDDTINDSTMMALSDDENIMATKNIYDVTKELNEKNQIIRKLKDELLDNKIIIDEFNLTNKNVGDSYVTKMNVPMINSTTNEPIIPKKTDIACWWYTYCFDTVPSYLPDHYHDSKYYVFGNFCSDNCMCAYNFSMGDYKVRERNSLLKQIRNDLNGHNITIKEIVPAGPREILKKFGGPVDIEKYRKDFENSSKEYRFMVPPMISIMPTVETLIKEKSIFKDINKFSPSDENEKSHKGSIISSMGIRVKTTN